MFSPLVPDTMRLSFCLLLLVMFFPRGAAGQALLFSEYIEGSGNNKALEIYNAGGSAADLSSYEIRYYFNGSTEPGLTIELGGVLDGGETYVLVHASADPALLDAADQTTGGGWYNGDDAVVLMSGGTVVDAIGQVGEDPGEAWMAGSITTRDATLRRAATVCTGDAEATDPFDVSSGWVGFEQGTFDGLGAHEANCGSGGTTAPRFTATLPDTTAQPGVLLTFDYDAEDDDGDALTFALLEAPTGAMLDAASGAFAWTPTEEQAGATYTVRVQVDDGTLSDLAVASVTVPAVVEGVPWFTQALASGVVPGDQPSLTVPYEAVDPEGDPLTYRLVEGPAGTSIDPSTGVFTWSPLETGAHRITVEVTDGTHTADTTAYVGVQGTLFPGEEGAVLREHLQQAYAPDQTLGYDLARDTLYLRVERGEGGQVCGVYTDYCVALPSGVDPSTHLFDQGINAEHVWPQSQGAADEPARSDMYNLYASRVAVNSDRGSLPFGEIADAEALAWYYRDEVRSTVPAAHIDAWSEIDATTFEPREVHKGDIARAALYFYAVYPQADEAFFERMMATLVQWDAADAAAAEDVKRSALIQTWQGNVNPFVLDTTLATRLTGLETAAAPRDASPGRLVLGVYPSPVREEAAVRFDLPEVAHVRLTLYDMLGRTVHVLEEQWRPAGTHVTRLEVTHLPAGVYLVRLQAGERRLTRRVYVVR